MGFRPISARAVSPVAIANLIVLPLAPGCWRSESLPSEDPSRLTIQLRSAAFADGGLIPKKDLVRPAGRIGVSSGSTRSTLDLS
jgi:hypothetical protein